jgi:CubicO group peptidase (beta-lactamase class C family)
MNWTKATEEAASIAAEWTREGGPGGAVLLFDAEHIRTEACGGMASLEFSIPFRADTATRFASISKQFLAALVLRHSAFGLDDKLGMLLSGLSPALGAVTVGRALDMTGGLPDTMETQWLLGVPWTASIGRDALLDFARRLDALNFASGTEISYSNTGYRLVQAALEARGVAYEEALRDAFFRPLGLTIRLPEDQTDPLPTLANGYWRGPRGWQRGVYGLHFSASGGLVGTARDLVTWSQALLADRGPARGLLPELARLRHLEDGRPTGYGLGLARSQIGDRVLVGHGGSLPGYKNHFLIDPESRAGVVVLTNREEVDPLGLALRVMAALHGEALPTVSDALPSGTFVAEDGPFWLEHDAGRVTFLGAQETVFAAPDGAAVSRSAHLPMRLLPAEGGIAGEIGHAARRFRPADPDAKLDARLNGDWVCPGQNARLATADGRLVVGAGPLRTELKLTPIASGLALTDRADGPWRQRAAVFLDGETLRLVGNRSRGLRLTRAG